MRADLNKVLKECCEKLRSLGQDRETTGQQTRYLLHLATSFQRMTGEALSTTYAAHDIFEKDDDLRLATSVVSLNDRFAETMRSTGHTLEFDSPNANPTNTISNHTVPLGSIAENKNPPATSSEDGAPSVQKQKSDKKGIATRTNKTPPEIEDLLADNTHIARPKSHRIIERLQETYRASRGFEIGTFQPSILSDTMKKQSRNWEPIALGYVSDVISLVHTFIGKLLDVVCTDQHVCTALKDAMYDQLVEKYNAAINHVEFLLQVERNEVPMTEDKGFYDSLNGKYVKWVLFQCRGRFADNKRFIAARNAKRPTRQAKLSPTLGLSPQSQKNSTMPKTSPYTFMIPFNPITKWHVCGSWTMSAVKQPGIFL